MQDIVFLGLERVMEIHRDQIRRYGGSEGIRDAGLLQSALAMPAATFGSEYLHADLYDMASAYLFHITQNHPFVDGNKRTGAAAALIFLDLNGIEVEASEEDFERLVREVATGQADKEAITDFFRRHA